MYIDYIKIKNYKCFDYSENNKIKFDQGLNLFIGRNNSGKSTIIEVLRLLNPILIFEEMQISWKTEFPDYDPRVYIDQKNFCKYSKYRPNFFEFEIEINNFSSYFKEEYFSIISNSKESYLRYCIRIFPFEQYFHFCLLKYLETDNIIVNIELPTNESYHVPLMPDILSEILVVKHFKNSNKNEKLDYNKYMNFSGIGGHLPEVELLKSLRFFYSKSFYPSFQHIIQTQKKDNSDIIPDYKLLSDLNGLQNKTFHYKKNKNTDNEDYINSRKILDEFIFYSKKILGKEKFHFVTETYDSQEERASRQSWPINESKEKLSNEEHYKKFKKLVGYFGEKFPYTLEYSSLGDGIKRALNIIFELLKFKLIKDESNFNYNSLCFIVDEFDMNMHSYLSRIVFRSILNISQEKTENNQLILTTHSNAFIDEISDTDINIFHIVQTSNSLSKAIMINDKMELLETFKELGYKPSQLFISNGIIWVEGPSDIIYIDFFLHEYLKFNGIENFERGRHYDFIMYGGSNIKHHEISDSFSERFINLLRINPNCFIVFDRDTYSFKNEKTCENNKRKIINAIANEEKFWMTQDAYMEYYLKQDDLKYFMSIGNE